MSELTILASTRATAADHPSDDADNVCLGGVSTAAFSYFFLQPSRLEDTSHFNFDPLRKFM